MRLAEPFHHALPVDERVFHDGLHVTHAGWERILPGQVYPNIDHPSFYYFKWEDGRAIPAFCIAWIVAGGGEFQTRNQHLHLKAGQVFLILPGEWHRHRPDPRTGWTLAWIEFNGTMPYRWWKDGAFGENPNLPKVRDTGLFFQQFEHLLDQVHLQPASNSPILSLKAIGVLAHMIQDTGARVEGGGTGDELVDQTITCIWNFCHGVIDVAAIARRIGVGRRAMERRFRATTGRGVLEEIQRCRFERAARLLVETDLPVKVIVVRAGFGSHEQLRQVFMKFEGSTPQAYRRRHSLPPVPLFSARDKQRPTTPEPREATAASGGAPNHPQSRAGGVRRPFVGRQ